MPRQARLDAPGTLHHVIIRGIERGGSWPIVRTAKASSRGSGAVPRRHAGAAARGLQVGDCEM